MTWESLFERGVAYETTEEAIAAALRTRRNADE